MGTPVTAKQTWKTYSAKQLLDEAQRLMRLAEESARLARRTRDRADELACPWCAVTISVQVTKYGTLMLDTAVAHHVPDCAGGAV